MVLKFTRGLDGSPPTNIDTSARTGADGMATGPCRYVVAARENDSSMVRYEGGSRRSVCDEMRRSDADNLFLQRILPLATLPLGPQMRAVGGVRLCVLDGGARVGDPRSSSLPPRSRGGGRAARERAPDARSFLPQSGLTQSVSQSVSQSQASQAGRQAGREVPCASERARAWARSAGAGGGREGGRLGGVLPAPARPAGANQRPSRRERQRIG